MSCSSLISLLLAVTVAGGISSLDDQDGVRFLDGRRLAQAETHPAETDVTAGDKVYKWTDADGVTHYGKEPPPEVRDAEQVDLGEQPISTIETTEVREEEKELLEQPEQPPAEGTE